jgi:hypothetical protein
MEPPVSVKNRDYDSGIIKKTVLKKKIMFKFLHQNVANDVQNQYLQPVSKNL